MSESRDLPLPRNAAEALRQGMRWSGDGLEQGLARPADVEPLASRLERSARVEQCRAMTQAMLDDLINRGWPVFVTPGVWVKGVYVDFLVLTWKGVYLVWSIDIRWTYRQAAMVMPARAQIQDEMGDWPGQVEGVFHSPRQRPEPEPRPAGWPQPVVSSSRQLLVDEHSGEATDIALVHGDISVWLKIVEAVNGVGIDPEWIRWMRSASQPRWWRSAEGMHTPYQGPPEEQL